MCTLDLKNQGIFKTDRLISAVFRLKPTSGTCFSHVSSQRSIHPQLARAPSTLEDSLPCCHLKLRRIKRADQVYGKRLCVSARVCCRFELQTFHLFEEHAEVILLYIFWCLHHLQAHHFKTQLAHGIDQWRRLTQWPYLTPIARRWSDGPMVRYHRSHLLSSDPPGFFCILHSRSQRRQDESTTRIGMTTSMHVYTVNACQYF